MKVIHIESGLGNQMLSYCEYLAIKKANHDDNCYLETIIYDIPECNSFICQWNGYELDRIFGIHAPNVREYFNPNVWDEIVNDIRKSVFWEKNWNYPVYFTQAFNKHGLELHNFIGNFEAKGATLNGIESDSIKSRLRKTYLGYWTKQAIDKAKQEKRLESVMKTDKVFVSSDEDLFSGQRLSFKFKGNDIERIDSEIRRAFIFPPYTNEADVQMSRLLQNTNSVAIHVRRGDMLGYNGECYRFGYFQRAVKLIRSKVINPVFVFFCDPGSVEWCKENEKVFGLNFNRDQVYFTDWNSGESSFRDMQLMTECKHQIITNSSFGWWASYLNQYPNKITISPDVTINSTHYV